MPNALGQQGMYIPSGDPDNYNEQTLYAPGLLGQIVELGDRRYQLVQVDSGCTASQATGVVAANQLAFWKDRSNYLVTNCSTFAIGGTTANAYRNQVGGVFRHAVTAGYYTLILQKGQNINVKSDGTAGGVGQEMMAASGTSADVTPNALGVASIYELLGVARGASANNLVRVDLDIPSVP